MKKSDYLSHPVHTVIASLLPEIAGIKSNFGGEVIDIFEQQKQAEYVKWCLAKSDYFLIQLPKLNSAQSYLETALATVRTLNSLGTMSDDASSRSNADGQLIDLSNYILNAVELLPYPRVRQIFKTEAVEAINEVKSFSVQAIAESRQSARNFEKDAKVQIGELNQLIEKERKALKIQEELLIKLQQEIADHVADVKLAAESKAKAFDVLITERQKQLDDWKTEVERKGSTFLSGIETYYNLTANITLAGRFEIASREELRSYYVNLTLGVLFFVAAIVSVMIETWYVDHGVFGVLSNPLYLWLGKISLVAVCVIPASIFSSQATKHRRASTWYKTVGVRIATLKPYLSEFKDDYTDELKEIIKSFFTSELKLDVGRRDSSLPTPKDLDSIVSFIERCRGLLKLP